ncbi:MAG TPA: hypothetical protein VFW33_22775, partial [Gemmataceae bacterium]|nr:hypothetical protein [Gemmataceae bacterium]
LGKPAAAPESRVNGYVDFKGGEGTAYFDRAAGRIVEVSTSQRLEVGQTAGGKTTTKKATVTGTMKPAEREKE